MFVLPFDELARLERFVPHEDIVAKLVEWKPGLGDVLFVSHTWLGNSHPDPLGVKLGVIQRLVERMRQKKHSVEGHAFAQAWFGPKKVRVAAAAMRSCQYLWFDFLSVPQRDAAAQGKAIESIFSYVHDAALFVVVAGPWKNEESGQWRDCRQWMRRGWCRLEMLANALSPAAKQVLLAESATWITSHGPSGLFGQQWFTSPVGTADFSAEADRSALGPVVLAMLQNRKALALAQGDLLTYRFIHAVSAKTLAGTGTSVPAEASLDEWMAAMRFTSGSPRDEGRSTGWTPLMFAVMSGRVELCEWLLDAGCTDVHSFMRNSYPQYALRKGTPLLHAACMVHDSPDIVRLLIRRGANPFKRMLAFPYKPAAHQAAGFGHVGNIDALAEHSPELLQQRDWFGFTFAMAVAFAHGMDDTAAHVLRTHRPMVERAMREEGMSLLALVLEAVGNLDTLRALLHAGCDPNRDTVKPATFSALNALTRAMQLYEAFGGRNHIAVESAYIWGAPALHVAACNGHLGAIEMLIEHGADPQLVPSNMPVRHTALHLAAWKGHNTCCQRLLEAGANPAAKDRRGRTPADWAERAEQSELAQMLRMLEAGDILHVTEGAAQVVADPNDMVAGVEVMRQRIQGDSAPVICHDDSDWAAFGRQGGDMRQGVLRQGDSAPVICHDDSDWAAFGRQGGDMT